MTIAIGLNILQDVPRAEEMGSIGVNLINRIDEGFEWLRSNVVEE